MAEDLTVAVIALLGGKPLDECIATVRAQSSNLLIVRRDGTIVNEEGAAVGVADRLDIPAKRRSAVQLAATPLVALIEDTVVPGGGWATAVGAVLGEEGAVACGGPVRIAEDLPAPTRALAMSEYGRFNEGAPAGDATTLPGCNFAFRRGPLLEAMRGLDGLVDLPVFERLRERGRLRWSAAMVVTFAHAFPEGARLRTRFDHGRIHASSKAGLASRAATAAKSLLLPAVLTARTLRDAGPVTMPTLGSLVLQHSAWAAGEFVGALLGPSKKGVGQWR